MVWGECWGGLLSEGAPQIYTDRGAAQRSSFFEGLGVSAGGLLSEVFTAIE